MLNRVTSIGACAEGLPSWPAMQDVIGKNRYRKVYERLKYQWFMAIATLLRRTFLVNLAKFPEWMELFDTNPQIFHVPIRRFLDRRWSLSDRFKNCAKDLEIAAAKFGPEVIRSLVSGHDVRICEQSYFSVNLLINRKCPYEGFWAFVLCDENQQQLFSLSFGFLDQNSILIASVQGSKSQNGSTIESIHSLTKHTHGLRPPFLLLNVFEMVCKHWGIQHIFGIDPEYQVTNFRRDAEGFSFDYRAFWVEHGAKQLPSGYWLLPEQPKRRAVEDIPTRKRSLYRRRYEFIDDLKTIVTQRMGNLMRPPVTRANVLKNANKQIK